MRRIIAVILCCFALCVPVFADNAASEINVTGTVTPNGSCQMALTVTIRLDEPVDSLTFPLGGEVSSVRLNGAGAGLVKTNGVTAVKLNSLKGLTGTFPMTIHYTVNSVVVPDENGVPYLSVPLLAGFRYPVETMQFSVTMPDLFDSVPAFFSGYHEQDIERSITSAVNGATVTGIVNQPLKDSETLTMHLKAPETMFPQTKVQGSSLLLYQIAMGILAALALLYWLLTMRCLPAFPIRRALPPEGISAGHAGSYLVHRGADLTLTVIHWAQLGYLIIQLEDNGRVLLHRKMDMGNERSSFEQQTFRHLFSKGSTVDATSYRYTKLCEKTALQSRHYSAGFLPKSGNPRLFRILCSGVSLFAGLALADSITASPAWRVLWMAGMAAGAVAAGWVIQSGMEYVHLHNRRKLTETLLAAIVVMAAGFLTKNLTMAEILLVWNLFAGLAAAYGGRRTENGARICQDLLGLRRYMKKVTKSELLRIMRTNSDYYFELAPYALALGVDRRLAKRFDTLRIPQCTWLVSSIGAARTAGEFYPMLRDAFKAMTADLNPPFWSRFLSRR